MKEHRFFPSGYHGCIFAPVSLVLAVCLMISSVIYQRHSDPFCYGRLDAGFPASFICDATGESPLSSVGIIDSADMLNIGPGFIVDILFYTVLLWITWIGLYGIWQLLRRRKQWR